MGQAKQRGNKNERSAQAMARIETLTPKIIVCGHCKSDISGERVRIMDSRGVPGITSPAGGVCTCGHVSWALSGSPAAVACAMAALQGHSGANSAKISITLVSAEAQYKPPKTRKQSKRLGILLFQEYINTAGSEQAGLEYIAKWLPK